MTKKKYITPIISVTKEEDDFTFVLSQSSHHKHKHSDDDPWNREHKDIFDNPFYNSQTLNDNK